MTRPMKELEEEYLQVKSDIKAHTTMIKMYADSIQNSRSKIDELSVQLTELQKEYIELTGKTEGKKDESTTKKSKSKRTPRKKAKKD